MKEKLILLFDVGLLQVGRFLVIEEYSNGFHYYRAVNLHTLALSEAAGKTLPELISEIEAIEEVIYMRQELVQEVVAK